MPKTNILFFVIALLLTGACSSSSAPTIYDDPEPAPAKHDEPEPAPAEYTDWDEERIQLDYDIEDFLRTGDSLAVGLEEGLENFQEAATERVEGQQELEVRIQAIAQRQDSADARGWSNLRVGQLYLNFACNLQNMNVPDEVPPDLADEYQQTVRSLVMPLIEQARASFQEARQSNTSPWSEDAEFLHDELTGFDGHTTCEATSVFWRGD